MGSNKGNGGASGPDNFIFVGPKLSLRKQGHDTTRSRLMRQYYRKKRAEQHASRSKNSDRSRSTGSEDSSAEASQESAQCHKAQQRQLVPIKKGHSALPTLRDPSTSPPPVLNADPIMCILGADWDTRSHFYRFLRSPGWTVEKRSGSERFLSFPLAAVLKYQTGVVGFAACSSRQMDSGSMSSLSLRSHNRLIKELNAKLLDAQKNSGEILLTIIGAIASAWYGGDEVETQLHVDAFRRFHRIFGAPKEDPDLMLMCVASSLRFNRELLDPPIVKGVEDDFDDFIYAFNVRPRPAHQTSGDNPSSVLADLVRYTNRLTGMLVSIHYQSRHMPLDKLRGERVHSQQRLFSSSSKLYHLLREPLLMTTASLPWQTAYDIGHWPYCIVYLTVLQFEMMSQAKSKQEETYAAIIAEIDNIRVPQDSKTALININWAILNLLKADVDRTWDVRLLVHALIRLDNEKVQNFLGLMFWSLSLDGDAPDVTLDEIKAIPTEIAKTVLGGSLTNDNDQCKPSGRIYEEPDATPG